MTWYTRFVTLSVPLRCSALSDGTVKGEMRSHEAGKLTSEKACSPST